MDNKKDNVERLYLCKMCNKKYSSYKTLWTHNNKFHDYKSKHKVSNPSVNSKSNISQ